MPGELTLLAIALLPLLAGLLIAGFGPSWQRWFGAEGALMLGFRIALGGTLLAALLLGTVVATLARRPELGPLQRVAWARVGHTTTLGLDVLLDALALVVAGLGLVVAFAVQIAALGDVRGGVRALGRSGLALGGTLLLALSASAWGAALGWQVLALVAGGCGRAGHGLEDRALGAGPEGHVPQDSERRGPWARASDAGVWAALLLLALGVGELGLQALERAALMGARSRLVVADIGGLSLATVAALGLVVAVLGRMRGLPAALRGEGPLTRAVLHGLVAGAGVLLLLRLHVLLALAPGVLAGLTVVGAGLALVAGVAALRAQEVALRLGRVTQGLLGLMLVAVGLGAWVPACGLLLTHGLASAALALAPEGRVGRMSGWLAALALVGLGPLGAGLWSGELLGASALYMSAWSPGLNGVVTVLVMLAMLAMLGALGAVAGDRSRSGGGLERGLSAVGLGLAAVCVGLIDMPGIGEALRLRLEPVFRLSWLLPGEFALGPRPPFTVGDARWGVIAALVIAAVGLGLGSRLRAWALRVPKITWPSGQGVLRRARALVRALHELGEQKLGPLLFMDPFEVRAARAPGPEHAQRGLVLGLLGALVVLGFVYCNPDVVQVGPSRVYPVDLGGLDPALLGSGRARESEAAP